MAFVIAEIGVNHDGDIEKAKALVSAAKDAGADAAKFQAYNADALEPDGQRRQMLARYQFTGEQFGELKSHCDDVGIAFLASPFDVESLSALLELGVKSIKIASGEMKNEALLEKACEAGKTIILSTGAHEPGEIRRAVQFIDQRRKGGLILLHCVSAYPAPIHDTNLKALNWLRSEFQASVGLSDHTTSIHIPIAAVAMGAVMIEKHLTLDRNAEGPDHQASLEPDAFKLMVEGIKEVESALGDGRKRIMPSEYAVRTVIDERNAFRGLR